MIAGAVFTPSGSLSLISLFTEAGTVVKFVILILVAASIWCWAIIISKIILIRRLRRESAVFEEKFWGGGNLEDLYSDVKDSRNPTALVFNAAMAELQRSETLLAARSGETDQTVISRRQSLRQRIERAMSLSADKEMEKISRGLAVLASVGATAPYVGLFGTVWGIMTSFAAIAALHDAGLAVVAPGISQALFATATGLAAAIPAVLAYNKFNTDIDAYGAGLDEFSTEFSAVLSRQFEEQAK